MKCLAPLLAMLLTGSVALADDAPFDMSPERPAASEPADRAKPATVPPTAPGLPAQAFRRYLLPTSDFVLSGEADRRSWSIFLTQEQAIAPAKLHLGYQNAIIVAPEASRLRLSVNGTTVIDAPIASPDKLSELVADVPAKLLHPGFNDISIDGAQRHRTDCDIQSTYELWTQLDNAKTFITFESAEAGRWKRIDDVRAVGVSEAGATRFRLIVPTLGQNAPTGVLLRAAEALGLLAGMPNQTFAVGTTEPAGAESGTANVVIGPASALSPVLAALPDGSLSEPTVDVVNDVKLGPSTLVITGPDWKAVEAAVESVVAQVDRPLSIQRSNLSTRAWHLPDIPLLTGAANLKFSTLGVATREFSGRRLRSDFNVGIPSDFYADAYGQATILLDAAYTDEVLPGSHIDVYVNDNIAATYPINTSGGAILRHLPVKVTMRHFRPGDNKISIETILMTNADASCAPGASAAGKQRFVLFDTSEFVMPEFARIGHTPDLAALSGTGFPYNRAEYALPVIVDKAQPEALSAAATMLARMSFAAGRAIPVDTSASMAAIADRNALIIGPVSQIPPTVLAQAGISPDSQTNWGEVVASIKPDTQATFEEWRDRLSGSGWRGQVSRLQDWMNRTFDISMDSFRIFSADEPLYQPPAGTNLLVAQQQSPAGDGLWMMVTSPSVASLKSGTDALVEQANWRQLGGRVAAFDGADQKLQTVAARSTAFIETQPASLANYRLVLANWLSANALSYSIALTLLSILLGLATAGFLGSLGRRR